MRHVSNAIMEVSRSRENAHAVLLVERFDGGRFAERPDFVVQEEMCIRDRDVPLSSFCRLSPWRPRCAS